MKSVSRGLFALTITTVLIAGAVSVCTEAQAACRMRPQCSTNSQCDSICGTGLGHCVHSSCPIRICKCS
jgi:hypothetical protein